MAWHNERHTIRDPKAPRPLRLELLESRDPVSTLYGLTEAGGLLRVDTANVNFPSTTVAVSGLVAGDTLVDIDFRPRTGQLIGLGVPAGAADTVRLYSINALTGVATAIGTAPFASPADGTRYGIDFNPTVDRLRVVNDGDANFRANPNNGARADVPNDIALNPGAFNVTAVAYDRNYDTNKTTPGTATGTTTLYGIDSATSSLVTIGGVNGVTNPNSGGVAVVGGLGYTIDPGTGVGFDIKSGGPAGGGEAFATLTVGGVTGLYRVNLATGAATAAGTIGLGAGTALKGFAITPDSRVVAATDAGVPAKIEVRDGFTGNLIRTLVPFEGFSGGVRVATGDVNRDGVPDIVAGAATGGGPRVTAFDGATGNVIYNFFAYESTYGGGINVAVGDVNGDGYGDIVVGSDQGGGPRVRAFSGFNGTTVLADFFAYEQAFAGGVRVSTADFDNNGTAEIVTSPGAGGGPRVRVFNGVGAGTLFTAASLPGFRADFFAYEPTYGGGINTASGDVTGDGIADIVVSADGGGGPRVRVFNGVNGAVQADFFAYSSTGPGGANGTRVALADFNADGRYEIRATLKTANATIRSFDGLTGTLLDEQAVLGGNTGIYIAGIRV